MQTIKLPEKKKKKNRKVFFSPWRRGKKKHPEETKSMNKKDEYILLKLKTYTHQKEKISLKWEKTYAIHRPTEWTYRIHKEFLQILKDKPPNRKNGEILHRIGNTYSQ